MKNKRTSPLLRHDEHFTIDVVCGMDLAASKVKHASLYNDVAYYFCSSHCKHHFDIYPERYVWNKKEAA